MTYSCTDFTGDVFSELARIGAIHPSEANDEDLPDNVDLQGDYAMAALGRLVEVKDALLEYRQALESLAMLKGYSLQDGPFCCADERVNRALAAIKVPPAG